MILFYQQFRKRSRIYIGWRNFEWKILLWFTTCAAYVTAFSCWCFSSSGIYRFSVSPVRFRRRFTITFETVAFDFVVIWRELLCMEWGINIRSLEVLVRNIINYFLSFSQYFQNFSKGIWKAFRSLKEN